MSIVRTLVVDDNQSIRRVLRSILNTYPEVEVIGEASNGEEAIDKVRELEPELIFMDVSMPVLDGLTAAELIKKLSPRTEIVMFSMHKISEFIETAKTLGLSGYILKEDVGSLLHAIEAILQHKTYFPPTHMSE